MDSGITINDEVNTKFNSLKMNISYQCNFLQCKTDIGACNPNPIIFIFYAPDSASVKKRMLYVSSSRILQKKINWN